MEIRCPNCGFTQDVPDEKIPSRAKLATCPKCGHKFYFREDIQEREEEFSFKETDIEAETEEQTGDQKQDIWEQLESLTEEDADSQGNYKGSFLGARNRGRGRVPWERLEEYGFFPGLFETVKQVMTAPVSFFYTLEIKPEFNKPLIFYVLIAEIQALAQFFWQMSGLFPKLEGQAESMLGMGILGMGSVFILILYPIILAAMLFLISAINHLCLLAVSSGDRGYQGTFRVMSYASAPMVISVVPVLGPIVGSLWTLVCTVLGFMYVHRATAAQVILALLLPLLVILIAFSLVALVMAIF